MNFEIDSGILLNKRINLSDSGSEDFQILESAWAGLALVVFPSISVGALGTSALVQKVWLWANTFLSVPDEGLLANTLVGWDIPVSWGWAFNAWWSISSSWANTLSSVPDVGWWWAFTGVGSIVPDSWSWAWNTVVTEGVWWAWAGLGSSIPLSLWGWADTVVSNNGSWQFTAWAFVSNVVPSVSWFTSDTSLADCIPMFGSITFNTVSTSDVVSLWAAWLLLIFTKSVVWNDLGKGSGEEKSD